MRVRIAKGKGCKVVSFPPKSCKFARLFRHYRNEERYPVCVHPESRGNRGWLIECPEMDSHKEAGLP